MQARSTPPRDEGLDSLITDSEDIGRPSAPRRGCKGDHYGIVHYRCLAQEGARWRCRDAPREVVAIALSWRCRAGCAARQWHKARPLPPLSSSNASSLLCGLVLNANLSCDLPSEKTRRRAFDRGCSFADGRDTWEEVRHGTTKIARRASAVRGRCWHTERNAEGSNTRASRSRKMTLSA